MADLESLIRQAGSRGNLNHLTLYCRNDGRFEGAYRDQLSEGHSVCIDADPVAALLGALRGRPAARPVERQAEPPRSRSTARKSAPRPIIDDLVG